LLTIKKGFVDEEYAMKPVARRPPEIEGESNQ
jgi:hypothetical protein